MKNGKLHSMSISRVFCVLYVANSAFIETAGRKKMLYSACALSTHLLDAFEIVNCFSTLVNRTYWYPHIHVDGKESVLLFNAKDGRKYMKSLLEQV